jgi:predicted membrane-bound mannosyltransferase
VVHQLYREHSTTIPLTGGCGAVNATGTITVTPNNTASAASTTPTLCISTVLTDITHATTGATGIGTATGLPAGVTAAFASNTITISGTPTVSGTFNYTIPLTGGCGAVNATGTITVTPNNASAASTTPTLCISTVLTDITHATTGATGIGTATGLPAGVTAAFSNTITISGTPTVSGTFNYTIPLTGGCGAVNATGTITVTPNNTSAASTTPTLCISTVLTDITHATTGATE